MPFAFAQDIIEMASATTKILLQQFRGCSRTPIHTRANVECLKEITFPSLSAFWLRSVIKGVAARRFEYPKSGLVWPMTHVITGEVLSEMDDI